MKLSYRFMSIVGSLVFLLSCKATQHGSNVKVDSLVAERPSYQSLRTKYREIADKDARVEFYDLGPTTSGDHQIFGLKIGPTSSNADRPPAVFLTEGIHGNEYYGFVTDLVDLMLSPELGDTPFFEQGGTVFAIPVINVDGYEYHRQLPLGDGPPGEFRKIATAQNIATYNTKGRFVVENECATDLNRTFHLEGTPASAQACRSRTSNEDGQLPKAETQAIKGWIDTIDRSYALGLALDYHCCLGGGTFTYYAVNGSELSEDDALRYGGLFSEIRASFGPATFQNTYGYKATGSLQDYLFDKTGALAMTYEARLYPVDTLDRQIALFTRLLANPTLDFGRKPLGPFVENHPPTSSQAGYACKDGNGSLNFRMRDLGGQAGAVHVRSNFQLETGHAPKSYEAEFYARNMQREESGGLSWLYTENGSYAHVETKKTTGDGTVELMEIELSQRIPRRVKVTSVLPSGESIMVVDCFIATE